MSKLQLDVIEDLRNVLRRHPSLRYAILFGSVARGTPHAWSDVDVAVRGLDGEASLELTSSLEPLVNRRVQVVRMERAPAALRFRIFRDGIVVVEPDPGCRISEQARTLVEYLDFKPVERVLLEGIRARARGSADGR